MKKTLAVPELLYAGLTPIRLQYSWEYRDVLSKKNKLELTGKAIQKPGSGHPRSARTKKIINKVKQLIKYNPVRSMRKLASELNVSHSSRQQVVKNDLNRARVKVPLRTKAHRQSRVQWSKALLNNIKHAAQGCAVLFSDEKIFTVDSVSNRRNDLWIGDDPAYVPDEV